MSSIEETAKALVEESKAELDALLDDLGHAGDEVKEKSKQVLELTIAATTAKLGGQDVTVAEGALKAASLDLAAISSSIVAEKVLNFGQTIIQKVGKALISVVVTAL